VDRAGAVGRMNAADALLLAIADWAVATKRTSSDLGQLVLNHPGFVPLLKKRGTLKPETDALLRAFMTRFPDRDALSPALFARLKSDARAANPWRPEKHAAMMARYGLASAPAAEGKPKISAAVIRAAKVDGRDLPTFVTACIEMGLACWRDDRLASGESVA